MTNVRRLLATAVPPACPRQRPAVHSAPAPATLLRHCRCTDCHHWDDEQGLCDVLPLRRYVPASHPALAAFPTRAGTVQPDAWHYCARYQGPQVSRDVWVWPIKAPGRRSGASSGVRAHKSARVPSGGDLTRGLVQPGRPGGNRPMHGVYHRSRRRSSNSWEVFPPGPLPPPSPTSHDVGPCGEIGAARGGTGRPAQEQARMAGERRRSTRGPVRADTRATGALFCPQQVSAGFALTISGPEEEGLVPRKSRVTPV